MKIAIPLWSLTRFRGGTERAGSDLANALVQRGHEVVVFTSGPGRLPPLYPLHPCIRLEYNLIHFRTRHSGLEELRRQVRAHAPDVLLGMGSDVSLLSYIAMVQGTETALLLSDRSAPFATGGINWNQPDRLAAFSAADRIHCQLPRYADSFPACLQARIQCIPNATSLPEYTDTVGQRLAHTPKILLALGRLRDVIKQQSLLIRAFALLHRTHLDWQLHIWGGDFYDESKELLQLIAYENLQDCVFLKGESLHVDEPLRTASLLCHPSRYEGFPMSVVEAMRHSLPVVGFAQCQALQDILDPSFSRLAPHMTAESLAETMAPLMADGILRGQLGEQALKMSRQYVMDTVVTQWEDLLHDTANTRRKHTALPIQRHAKTHAAAAIEPTQLPEVHRWQTIYTLFFHLLKTSSLFDYDWYRTNYVHGPEVMDPLEHYLLFGADKGYSPNAWFNTATYRGHYLSETDGMNPLLHYFLWGRAAGYDPAPCYSIC